MQTRTDATAHDGFVRKLLETLFSSVSEPIRNVKQRLCAESKCDVLEGRFALGADSDAYLRANVLPLHSTSDESNTHMGENLNPEMQWASRQGLLDAMELHITDEKEEKLAQMRDVLRCAGWMLSIPEVYEFVNNNLALLGNEEAKNLLSESFSLEEGASADAAVESFSRIFSQPPRPSKQDVSYNLEKILASRCAILRSLLLLFGTPMEKVDEQWKKTLGPENSASNDLFNAIDKLARSARRVEATFKADQIPLSGEYKTVEMPRIPSPTSLPVRPRPTDEIFVMALKTWKLASADTGVPGPVSLQQAVVNFGAAWFFGKAQLSFSRDPGAASVPVLTEDETISTIANLVQQMTTKNDATWWGDQQNLALMQQQFRKELQNDSADKILATLFINIQTMPEYNNNVLVMNSVGSALTLLKNKNLAQRPALEMERDAIIVALSLAEVLSVMEDNLDAEAFREQVVQKMSEKTFMQTGRTADALDTVVGNNEEYRQYVNELAELVKLFDQSKPFQDGNVMVAKARIPELIALIAAAILKYGASTKPSDGGDATNPKPEKEMPELESVPRQQTSATQTSDDDDDESYDEVVPDLPKFCIEKSIITEEEESLALDGLCAAISQLREDGGFGMFEMDDGFVLQRGTGVSPFFSEIRERLLSRKGNTQDWWRGTLWPSGDCGTIGETSIQNLGSTLDSSRDPPIASDALTGPNASEGECAVSYALCRGLCSRRGPHHVVPNKDTNLRYTRPRTSFPEIAALRNAKNTDRLLNGPLSVKERSDVRCSFAGAEKDVKPVYDFSDVETTTEIEEKEAVAMWVPVKKKNIITNRRGSNGNVFLPSATLEEQAVATASVLEHMIDYYKRKAQRKNNVEYDMNFDLACSAAAKIRQLHSMAQVAAQIQKGGSLLLCPWFQTITDKSGAIKEADFFMTRPVLRCPGTDRKVLYPPDAGLASIRAFTKQTYYGSYTEGLSTNPGNAWGQVEVSQDASVISRKEVSRKEVSRKEATQYLRAALGKSTPLYVAENPIQKGYETSAVEFPAARMSNRNDLSSGFPTEDNINLCTVPVLRATLREGIDLCTQLEKLICEERHVSEAREQTPEQAGMPVSGNEVARRKRMAVWNDALREAAISGDRLYAFARQLSGTISESVDAVCVIDEGSLAQEASQERQRRIRAAERAAQDQAQLVRTAVSAVIRESDLQIGVSETGGEFKVVSSGLRKQAAELSKGNGSNGGFFDNTVRLERLLAQGTGEMTLKDLFARLNEAGVEMQRAALDNGGVGPSQSLSLDVLSAPRNSLLLRWNSESLAAIRIAFDRFQSEMQAQHGYLMNRRISAFELIEGRDGSLCAAFAAFAAHCLVHSRMYSGPNSAYVSAWAAKANAQQLRISLHRLVTRACEYLSNNSPPAFLSTTGRKGYFGVLA